MVPKPATFDADIYRFVTHDGTQEILDAASRLGERAAREWEKLAMPIIIGRDGNLRQAKSVASMFPKLCCFTSQEKGHAFCGRCGEKLLHLTCDGMKVVERRPGSPICVWEIDIIGARTKGQAARVAMLLMARYIGFSARTLESYVIGPLCENPDDVASSSRETVRLTTNF